MENIIFKVHDQPGLTYTPEQKSILLKGLRTLGSESLNPLPNYQVFSTSPTALDDKIIVTASSRSCSSPKLLAFTSSVLLSIPGVEGNVLHSGLTVVSRSVRRRGLVVALFMHLLVYVYKTRASSTKSKIWLSSLAEVPNSLVHFSKYLGEVYPALGNPKPNEMQLKIARAISKNEREKMLISKEAVFDEERFVFLGSTDSEEGKIFMKDVDDEQYWHRDKERNDWFRGMFRRMKGDEVLQVGYLDADVIRRANIPLDVRGKL